MKVLGMALLAAAVVLSSGCATVLNEKTQKINIASSNGKPIEGTINGTPFKGPGVVEVLRENKDKILVTNTQGCVNQTALPKTVDMKFFVNIFSGAFGSSTDYATEKMWQYQENVVIQCH